MLSKGQKTAKSQINFNNINEIKSEGFSGFKTVKSLWEDQSCLPNIKGVYLVLDPHKDNPRFINPGVGFR